MRTDTQHFPRQSAKTKEENNFANFSHSTQNNRIAMYFSHHLSALLSSAGRLMRSPLTTLMTLIVIGIALALPASLFLLLENVKHLGQNWDESSQISIYLKTNISPAQTQSLLTHLKKQSGIAQVKYISPQQGLAELQNQPLLQNDVSSLTANPLPGVILIEPDQSVQSPQALDDLVQQLKLLPQVDLAQLDMQWIKRLFAILDLLKHLVFALGFLLGAGVLFIIGNTIHLNLQKYQREIEIFKLVGATDGFIRRPFLYAGLWYGLIGGLFALLLVTLLMFGLANPVHTLANLYNSNFHLQSLTLSSATILLLTAIVLGIMGAWLAIGKHLKIV